MEKAVGLQGAIIGLSQNLTRREGLTEVCNRVLRTKLREFRPTFLPSFPKPHLCLPVFLVLLRQINVSQLLKHHRVVICCATLARSRYRITNRDPSLLLFPPRVQLSKCRQRLRHSRWPPRVTIARPCRPKVRLSRGSTLMATISHPRPHRPVRRSAAGGTP